MNSNAALLISTLKQKPCALPSNTDVDRFYHYKFEILAEKSKALLRSFLEICFNCFACSTESNNQDGWEANPGSTSSSHVPEVDFAATWQHNSSVVWCTQQLQPASSWYLLYIALRNKHIDWPTFTRPPRTSEQHVTRQAKHSDVRRITARSLNRRQPMGQRRVERNHSTNTVKESLFAAVIHCTFHFPSYCNFFKGLLGFNFIYTTD